MARARAPLGGAGLGQVPSAAGKGALEAAHGVPVGLAVGAFALDVGLGFVSSRGYSPIGSPPGVRVGPGNSALTRTPWRGPMPRRARRVSGLVPCAMVASGASSCSPHGGGQARDV